MTARWLTGNVLAFDLETTGPEPETARIVTAHAVECGPDGARVRGNWLVNPGCPIPAEATLIHKITDEIAATGSTPEAAIRHIDAVLGRAKADGVPLVIMNASYDLTVVEREMARVGFECRYGFGPVLDPHVIDRGLNPFRKGKRQLMDLAKHYRIKLGEAHSADGDALMAARIVWAMAQKGRDIQHLTLNEMQRWQEATHRKWALQYRSHLRGQAKPSDIDDSWPLRSPSNAAPTATDRSAA